MRRDVIQRHGDHELLSAHKDVQLHVLTSVLVRTRGDSNLPLAVAAIFYEQIASYRVQEDEALAAENELLKNETWRRRMSGFGSSFGTDRNALHLQEAIPAVALPHVRRVSLRSLTLISCAAKLSVRCASTRVLPKRHC